MGPCTLVTRQALCAMEVLPSTASPLTAVQATHQHPSRDTWAEADPALVVTLVLTGSLPGPRSLLGT